MERKLTKVVDGTEITVGGKMCSCGTDVANDLCSWECPDTCREYSVYTKKKRQRRLSINSLSIIYSYMDYKRLGRNSHFEREEMQGYSDAFIDLDKVPIVINGKKL